MPGEKFTRIEIKGARVAAQHGDRVEWTRWAVFPEAVVQAASEEWEADVYETLEGLTGWCARYGAPGQAFCGEPGMWKRGKHWIIRQSGGLDI